MLKVEKWLGGILNGLLKCCFTFKTADNLFTFILLKCNTVLAFEK